jgi:hypothetical protein
MVATRSSGQYSNHTANGNLIIKDKQESSTPVVQRRSSNAAASSKAPRAAEPTPKPTASNSAASRN